MSAYIYEFDNFGLSEGHLHFLRNRYCYKKLAFKDIDSIRLKKGKSVNNWFLMLIIGIVLTLGTFIFYFIVFILISHKGITPTERRIKTDGLLLFAPLFIGLMGVLLIRQSLISCLILEIKSNGFAKKCWLPKYIERKDLLSLVQFLKQKCAGKVEADLIL